MNPLWGDGDEIIVGRYRLHFVDAALAEERPARRFLRRTVDATAI